MDYLLPFLLRKPRKTFETFWERPEHTWRLLSRFWPICPFGARNGQICTVALLGPEMVKFAPNFCYCAIDQEKAFFQWKRAVSRPSALLGPEMVKFAPDFCYCAVDQEQAVFQWKRAVSSFLPFWGPKWSNLHRISALVLYTKKRPFFNGNGPFLVHLPFKWSNLHRISAIVL